MADSTTLATKSPWHLWVVGVVAVLWNTVGVLDFTMTQGNSEAWLKDFTPEQRAYIFSFPLWAVIAWGAGVYGGFLGSILLLFRSRWAVAVFRVSIAGAIVTTIYSHLINNGNRVMGGGPGPMIFSAVIVAIALLLWYYACVMARRGVLR